MFKLKPISKESIPTALEKAERYRLLGEPLLAESICLDILESDPENNRAIVFLILAITDQFSTSSDADPNRAKQLIPRLTDEYERHYYGGIISERNGKATLQKRKSYGNVVYELLTDAMEHYEKAELIRPAGNDDAILRWNTCARLIANERLEPTREQYLEPELE
jgi:hypothetical protein